MQTEPPPPEEALARLNLANLFRLWESVGEANGTLEIHRGFRKIYNHGSSWPNRVWLTREASEELVHAALRDAYEHLIQEDKPILLVLTENQAEAHSDWLKANGLSRLFSQTGMMLELEKPFLSANVEGLSVIMARSRDETSLWSRIASEAFGYSVDPAVVQNAVGSPGVTLYLGFRGGEAAGTGLLCTHEGVAGFHMAGTRPQHRRKGVARQMMHHLIREAEAGRFRYGTLQASAMGEPLYSQLGFTKQFILHNYLFTGR